MNDTVGYVRCCETLKLARLYKTKKGLELRIVCLDSPEKLPTKIDEDIVLPDKFKHFKGGEYKGLAFANNALTDERVVIYQSLKNGEVWFRERTNFFEYLKDRECFRFTQIN